MNKSESRGSTSSKTTRSSNSAQMKEGTSRAGKSSGRSDPDMQQSGRSGPGGDQHTRAGNTGFGSGQISPQTHQTSSRRATPSTKPGAGRSGTR